MLPMLAAALLATTPPAEVDRLWAQLPGDLRRGDAAAFAAHRTAIVAQYAQALQRWGARLRETYEGVGYAVAAYDGPTQVSGERGRAAYFAVVTPHDAFGQPTLWEVDPVFSPQGGQRWLLQVAGCDLKTGASLSGHPRTWSTPDETSLPAYADFKATLARTLAEGRAFPVDTARFESVGAVCLYVGQVSDARLLSEVLERYRTGAPSPSGGGR